MGLIPSTIEVPTGVQGMIERKAALKGLPALGLWAQVPHYVSSMPYPGASAALLERPTRRPASTCPLGDLDERAIANRNRLDQLVEQNPDHVAMLRQLEAQVDEAAATQQLSATSGDELAAELERYLRDQN